MRSEFLLNRPMYGCHTHMVLLQAGPGILCYLERNHMLNRGKSYVTWREISFLLVTNTIKWRLTTFIALVVLIHCARLIVTGTDYLPIISLSDQKQEIIVTIIFFTCSRPKAINHCHHFATLRSRPVETSSCVLSHGIVVANIRPFYYCLRHKTMSKISQNFHPTL